MKRILVTAFEPFGGSARNSSLDTLRSLPERIADAEILKAEMPVEYAGAGEALARILGTEPGISAVVCLGQAEGRGSVTPEVIAVNLRNGSIPDNAGVRCSFDPCEPGGPDGIFSTLPVRKIAERLNGKKIPAAPSFSAGAYVCNSLMYAVLRLTKERGIPAGFIHLPLSSEIALAEGKASRTLSLPQSVLTEGIAEALAAIAEEIGEK